MFEYRHKLHLSTTAYYSTKQYKFMYFNALCKLVFKKSRVLTKTIRIMKLTTVFIIAAFLQVSAKGYSQNITLNQTNVPLQKVFEEIRKQTDYQFFYADEVVSSAKNVTVNIKKGSIEDVLDLCFKNQQLGYTISENTIIVKRKVIIPEVNAPPVPEPVSTAIDIKGKITDNKGQPLEGAAIIDKKTGKGVVSFSTGQFVIKVSGLPASLEISYTGYQRRIVTANNSSIPDIVLEEKNPELDEVIVTGFGTQKKASQTAAISSVGQAELKQMPVSNITNALAGRLPGLITQQRTGLPGGDAASILQIRGYGTFNTTGQTPLVLVDGVERRFDEVDFNEVDNISILKDASATAVFGVRGANGVILITTKRGKIGKPKVTLSVDNSMQMVTKLPKYLQSYDYATLYNEAFLNDGGDPNNIPYNATALQKYKDKSDPYLYPDVNWYDEVVSQSARMTTVNGTVSGGTQKARYFITGTYLNQEGLFRKYSNFEGFNTNSLYRRYNFRSNVDFDITSTTTFSMSLSGKHSKQTIPGSGQDVGFGPTSQLWWDMARWAPNLSPIYNPNGSLGSFIETNNIIGNMSRSGFLNNYRTDIEANLDLKQNLNFITKGLSFRSKFVFDTYFQYTERRAKNYETFKYGLNSFGLPVYLAGKIETPINFAWLSETSTKHIYTENAIEYKRIFNGQHDISGLLLAYTDRARSGSSYPTSRLGYASRATYGYKGKYFGEINIGYNGTENFAKGKRMGVFPAYSVGWLASEEPWMDKWIDKLKFRLSIGQVGNANIGGRRYLYLPDTWGAAAGYTFGATPSGLPGAFELNSGNPNVTWETAWKKNLGIEMAMFKNAVSISVDLFDEKRDNILLFRQDVPLVIGQAALPPVNVGIMSNKGYEIVVRYSKKLSKDLSFEVGGNYNYVRNKILHQTEPTRAYPWLQTTGKRFGEQFGYISEGFFNSQDEITKWANQSAFGTIMPGDIKYRDLNNDGIINEFDRTAIGNPQVPEITYAFNTSVSFKNFDLDVQFQGVGNTSVFVSTQGAWEFYDGAKVATHHLGRWTPQTAATATYPRLTTSSTAAKNNFQTSTFWVRDAAYMRLKNIALGYNFGKKVTKKLRLDVLKLQLTASNIYTWSKFKLFDPEIRASSGTVYPQQKTFNLSIYTNF